MQETTRLPLDIQHFAEVAAEAETSGDDETAGGGTKQTKTENPFDEFLRDPKNQGEFDRRVAKALETARSKWNSETQSKIEAAKTEAEKLAKMNAEQKAKYEQEQLAEALKKREQEITRRELHATVLDTLAEKGLPKGLAEIADYTDADSCSKSVEAIEQVFRAAVQEGVEARLKGNGAPKKGTATQAQEAKTVTDKVANKISTLFEE